MNGKVYLLITLPGKQLFLTAAPSSQKLACNSCVINQKHASAPQTKIILKVYDRYWWLSKCSEELVAPKIRIKNEMGRKHILEYLQLTFKKACGGLKQISEH